MTSSAIAVIGVDVGTSGCKAVALDERGRAVATASSTYAVRRRADGEVTHDARDYVRASEATIRECVGQLDHRRVEALAFTGPAHYAVLTGDDGQPLARTLLASDGRPAAVAEELRAAHGDAFFRTTYEQLSAGWTFAQLVWLRRNDPSLWPRIRRVLVVKDYVRYILTGEANTDPSDATGTAMVDQATGTWSPELCAEAEVSPGQMPTILPSSAIGGRLRPDWAQRLGVRSGTPVAVGATDTAAELVSLGAVTSGASLVKIASTGTVVAVSDQPHPDPRLLTYPHAVAGCWYSLGATSTAATAFTWLRESVFRAPDGSFTAAYEEMDRLASRVGPGAAGLLFLPYLEGERAPHWDANLRAAFLGLSSAHGPAHLARAVLEGVAFSLQHCRRVLEEAGFRIDAPFLAGGGMSSRLWRSIVVATLGLNGRLAEPQGPAVGAALLAAASVGVPPVADGRPTGHPRLTTVRPNAAWAAAYEHLFRIYLQADGATAGVAHALRAFARDEMHPPADAR